MRKLVRAFVFALVLTGLSRAMADDEPLAATVISLEGDVLFDDAGKLKAVVLGQLLADGDRVLTRENSALQLILADGSSLALGPSSEVTLKALGRGNGSKTVIQLLRGILNAIVEKLTADSSFEIHTANAVAAVKGTEFELEAGEDDTQVTVNEGEVQFGDPSGKAVQRVKPLERSRLAQGRLNRATRLSKRELGEFKGRWERARLFHKGRLQTLHHLREHGAKERREFKQRRERRSEGAKEKRSDRREKLRDRLKERKDKRKKEEEEGED